MSCIFNAEVLGSGLNRKRSLIVPGVYWSLFEASAEEHPSTHFLQVN